MKERIQKLLANAGVASRRAIEEMILQGRVAVNGQVRYDLPILIDPAHDEVTVDDERVKLRRTDGAPGNAKERGDPASLVYIIMNKPKGVFSTNVAQGEQLRAIDLLPPGFRTRVYPVGRLDADSEGLLLLTNDGDLTNKLTHPRYEISKTYRAVVDGYVQGDELTELKTGIWLADPKKRSGFKTGRSYITIVRRHKVRSTIDITIQEGRNRQIRRMLAKVGHKVRDLTRIKMGPLELGKLKPGQSRLLTPREVTELRKATTRALAGSDAAANVETESHVPVDSKERGPRGPHGTRSNNRSQSHTASRANSSRGNAQRNRRGSR